MTAPSAMIPPAFVAVIQMERWGIAHSMYRPSASVMVLTITRSGIHSPVILAPATGFRPCGVDSKTTPETIGEVTFSPGGIPAAAAASAARRYAVSDDTRERTGRHRQPLGRHDRRGDRGRRGAATGGRREDDQERRQCSLHHEPSGVFEVGCSRAAQQRIKR